MSLPLSKNVRRALEVLFDEPRRALLAKRLEEEAAENLPFHEKSNSAEMDRIRLSILKLVGQDEWEEDAAFELAMDDWRDLFMSAGFEEVEEHERWYRGLVGEDADGGGSGGRPWWALWRN